MRPRYDGRLAFIRQALRNPSRSFSEDVQRRRRSRPESTVTLVMFAKLAGA